MLANILRKLLNVETTIRITIENNKFTVVILKVLQFLTEQ